MNSVLHEPYLPKQIKTGSQSKLDFCSSGWVWGENKPERTMHLSVMWQRWGGGDSERSPWIQWTIFGEVRQEKSSIEVEQMFLSHPSCSSDTLRHRLAYFCSSAYRPSGIQLVLEKSLHPFPFISKVKMPTLEGSVL